MSDRTTEATDTPRAAATQPEEPKFKITAETHGISLMLLAPTTLGRAFTDIDDPERPKKIQNALDYLKLTDNGKIAAAELMKAFEVNLGVVETVADVLKLTYAGSEPHPTDTLARDMIEILQTIP